MQKQPILLIEQQGRHGKGVTQARLHQLQIEVIQQSVWLGQQQALLLLVLAIGPFIRDRTKAPQKAASTPRMGNSITSTSSLSSSLKVSGMKRLPMPAKVTCQGPTPACQGPTRRAAGCCRQIVATEEVDVFHQLQLLALMPEVCQGIARCCGGSAHSHSPV